MRRPRHHPLRPTLPPRPMVQRRIHRSANSLSLAVPPAGCPSNPSPAAQ
jgi:hypothetical protein